MVHSPGFQSGVQVIFENGVLKGRRKHGDKMPQSLHSNFVDIVFSTKNREPMIGGKVAGRIHSYLAAIVQDQMMSCIQNQAEHHKIVTFQEECRKFLKSYNIEFDERYVWD